MGHWADVRNAESQYLTSNFLIFNNQSSTRSTKRDYYDEGRQGGYRDNSYEDDKKAHSQGYRGHQRNEDQETQYSMRHQGKAKTYGPDRDDFEGYDNKPRLSNHNQNTTTRVQSQKTTSFDDFDKFSNFNKGENKENRQQENMMDTRAQVKPSKIF